MDECIFFLLEVGRLLCFLACGGWIGPLHQRIHESTRKFLLRTSMSDLSRPPKTNSNLENVGSSGNSSPRGLATSDDRGNIVEGTNKAQEGTKARSSRNKNHSKPTTSDGDRKQAGVRSRVFYVVI